MNRFEHDLEKAFADVAMAEENDFTAVTDDLEDAAETFDCSCVDVAFAEEGEFTVTSCHAGHRR